MSQVNLASEQPVSKQNVEDLYELSPMQQGMLFETLYAPESGVYVTQLCLTLDSSLNVSAFRQAWQELVDQHPILRTLFIWQRDKAPLQMVRKQVVLPWIVLDWRGCADVEAALTDWLQTDRQQGFTLDQAPLMRCTLMQTPADSWQFVWSCHHLISDGWSLPILLQELLTRYRSACGGRSISLPAPRPYRDYILWLRRQDRPRAETFWRTQVQSFTAPTPFNVDQRTHSRSTDAANYASLQNVLSAARFAALNTFAQMHHLTLNTLIQGAWALLLGRYSGNSEVLFGATVSGRPPSLAGVEQMVGLFINTLPVAVRLSPEQPVRSWLQTLQENQSAAQEYSYLSLTDIQRWSGIPSGTPLFDSILVFENYPFDQERATDFTLIQDLRSQEQTNFPLTIVVLPHTELSLSFRYDTHRFECATIERMAGHFEILLQAIVANPDQPIGQLPLLTAAERHQLLVEWNETATHYPKDKTIHQLFEEQVARTPNAVAVVSPKSQVMSHESPVLSQTTCDFGLRTDDSLTYAELNARANQLAHYLQSLGVGPEVLVGICVERSIEMVVGLLGVLKAGGAYVPLDPSYPQERLAFMLQDSAVSVLLTQTTLQNSLPTTNLALVCLDKGKVDFATQTTDNPISHAQVENLAYVIYTSGSTGQPKGAMNTHGGISNLLYDLQTKLCLTTEDRTLQTTVFSFDVATAEILWPLLNGASLVLTKPDGQRDSTYLVAMIRQHQITTLHLVPTLLQLLVEELDFANCTTLKHLIMAGEALPFTLQQRFFNCLTAQLHNWYGPTEAAVYVTAWQCQALSSQSIVPIGRPVANTQIYVLDAALQPMPIGIAGELYIGGIQVGRGYLNRPELTAERFIANPFGEGRLYKTGDLCRWLADGTIEYLGRIDQQVKIRGFRIELGEIEAVLSQHPAVQEAVVIAREDTPGEKRLVAYVVRSQKSEVRSPESSSESRRLTSDGSTECAEIKSSLRSYLQSKLPEYMLPSAFVELDALPLTPNGKMDRKALPAPDTSALSSKQTFVAPRTPTERTLADIWAAVLGLEQIGIHDNFFELGGHSLLATQVVSRIRQALTVDVSLRQLFQTPTIIDLAHYLENAQLLQIMRPTAMASKGNTTRRL